MTSSSPRPRNLPSAMPLVHLLHDSHAKKISSQRDCGNKCFQPGCQTLLVEGKMKRSTTRARACVCVCNEPSSSLSLSTNLASSLNRSSPSDLRCMASSCNEHRVFLTLLSPEGPPRRFVAGHDFSKRCHPAPEHLSTTGNFGGTNQGPVKKTHLSYSCSF